MDVDVLEQRLDKTINKGRAWRSPASKVHKVYVLLFPSSTYSCKSNKTWAEQEHCRRFWLNIFLH